MVVNCVAYKCNNLHDINKTISFHTFPFKRPEILKLWVRAIRRKDWNPSKTSRLCGEHFLPSDYQDIPDSKRRILKPDAVPSVFNFPKHLKNVTKPRKEPTQRVPSGDSKPSVLNFPKHLKNVTKLLEEPTRCVASGDSEASVLNFPKHLKNVTKHLQEPTQCVTSGDSEPNVLNFPKHVKNVTKPQQEPTRCVTSGDSKPMEVEINLPSLSGPKTFVDKEAQTIENYSTDFFLKRKVKTLQQKINRKEITILNMKRKIKKLSKSGSSNAKLDEVLKNYFEGIPLELVLLKKVDCSLKHSAKRRHSSIIK